MIRSIVFAVWTILSTSLYGSVAILIAGVWREGARWIERQWCHHLLAVGGVRVAGAGLDRLRYRGRYVVACNHASAFDIPILIASLPLNLTFMAKKELFRIPIFGWGITALGHIPVDRSRARKAREAISHAAGRVRKEDIALLLFPEGTRSETGRIADFKSASFALALEAGVDVLPVLIAGSHRILRKRSWIIHPGEVRLCAGEPIPASELAGTDKKTLCTRVQAAIMAMKNST
ncbi:MAG: 1-acylglycerol-3-phosphate O-acyltransferase [Chitinivibrionales bacterium]|nr:1-acylglycerol-3-phosphate O-acyltransferase [Chitinivibrionales bacterium]MBD3394356.1 1-acylglycerol-3-phosphate O-acyltransferase [Chitinivibrionales bacterium]